MGDGRAKVISNAGDEGGKFCLKVPCEAPFRSVTEMTFMSPVLNRKFGGVALLRAPRVLGLYFFALQDRVNSAKSIMAAGSLKFNLILRFPWVLISNTLRRVASRMFTSITEAVYVNGKTETSYRASPI